MDATLTEAHSTSCDRQCEKQMGLTNTDIFLSFSFDKFSALCLVPAAQTTISRIVRRRAPCMSMSAAERCTCA